MPGPTNTELIRRLTQDVAVLKERVQMLREETADIRGINTRLALLEHQVAELKRGKESVAARAWMLLASLAGGVAGALLTNYFKR